MTKPHPFDEATRLFQSEPGVWSGASTEAYANMVGSFGGIASATLLNAVVSDERRIGHPVSLTVNFCAGVGEGGFDIRSTLHRTGKYTQHWSLELTQEEKLCSTATVVCGVRGEVFSHQPAVMPDVQPAEDCAPLPSMGFLNWVDRYTFRFVEGAMPGTNRAAGALASARTVAWVNDNPARPLDHLSLAALSDSFFLRLFHVRGNMEPMGSVTLTTHFLATPDELEEQGSKPLLGIADSTRFHANFHDQQIQLWGSNGQVLATGTQVAWYKQ